VPRGGEERSGKDRRDSLSLEEVEGEVVYIPT
jgi:hypothetical protein